MDIDSLIEQLTDAEALLLEPRAVFDAALVGIAYRAGGMHVACYDGERCIDALMLENGWDYEEAADWFAVNTAGAYAGDGTPVFIDMLVAA